MKLKVATILVTVLLILSWIGSCQAGLGISPSQWIEKHALRGSHIEKIFTLSRAEPKEDLYFKAEIEGEIKDWIKIDPVREAQENDYSTENKFSNGVEINFFYSAICPHCEKEKEFLKELEKKYPEIEIKKYEVISSPENQEILKNFYEK